MLRLWFFIAFSSTLANLAPVFGLLIFYYPDGLTDYLSSIICNAITAVFFTWWMTRLLKEMNAIDKQEHRMQAFRRDS